MASSARIEELEKKFNENPRRYFAPLANEYRKAGEIEQAITLCRAYLPQQPGHMSGHIVFGQALFDAGHLDEAQGVFETALGLDPENLIALRHLGDIARLRGDVSVARTWYQRVLDADPRNEEIAAQLGELGVGSAAAPAAETPAGEVSWKDVNPEQSKTATTVEPPSAGKVSTPASTAGSEGAAPTATAGSKGAAPPATAGSKGAAPPATAGSEEAAPPATAGATAAPSPSVEAAEPEIAIDIDTLFDAAEGKAPAAEAPAAPSPPSSLPDGDLEVAEFVPPQSPEALPRALGLETGHESVVGGQIEGAPAGPPSVQGTPFVTETMAELYLQQGFVREALAVYRQLLEASPDDPGLRERVDQLEHGARSSLSMAELSDEVVEAAQRRQTSPMRRSMRAFLGSLATRRAPRRSGERPVIEPADDRTVGGGARIDQGAQPAAEEPIREAPESAEQFPAAESTEQFPEAAATPMPTPAPYDSPAALDVLFDGRPVTPEDQAAARALAGAFNSSSVRTSTTPLSGRPARTAPTELSLDHVFRESGGDAGLGKQRSDFSFDQFFADEATDGSSEPSAEPDTQPVESGQPGEDDIGQFNDWLEGLKKK